MAKGKMRRGWLLAILVFGLALTGLVSYLIISPYFGWTSYTIDNFISFRYPAKWHIQQEGSKELSGVENLFLISDYNGNLSMQSLSSPDQIYLGEVSKVSRTKYKDISSFSSFLDAWCKNDTCKMQASDFQKNGYSLRQVVITNEGITSNGVQSTFSGEIFMFVEGKQDIYMIHIGFTPSVGSFSDFFRQRIVKTVFDSVQLNMQ